MLVAISFLFFIIRCREFLNRNWPTGVLYLVFVKYCIIRVHSSVYRSLHLFHHFIFVIIHSYFNIHFFPPVITIVIDH